MSRSELETEVVLLRLMLPKAVAAVCIRARCAVERSLVIVSNSMNQLVQNRINNAVCSIQPSNVWKERKQHRSTVKREDVVVMNRRNLQYVSVPFRQSINSVSSSSGSEIELETKASGFHSSHSLRQRGIEL